MLIVIDPGHGGVDRANRGPTGYVEADGVLDIALKLKKLLTGVYEVRLTRDTNKTVELYDRPAMANEWGADLFISLHTNAAADPAAGGIETWFSRNGEQGDKYHEQARKVAEAVQQHLVQATGLRDRGIKTRLVDNPGSPIDGLDYYAVIRRANCPAIIVEAGFHTNPDEEARLKTQVFRLLVADAIAAGIESVYLPVALTPIVGTAAATLAQARAVLQQKAPDWVLLANVYWAIAPIYYIRPDVALAQACKETGYFRFGGLVQPAQNNFCGLGATGPGNPGHSFPDKATGVEAHIQHLYAYATTDPLPAGAELIDPRFNLVKRGTAPVVEYLGAAENPAGVGWAYPGKDYGHSIVRDYLTSMINTEVVEVPADTRVEELLAKVRNLQAENDQLRQQAEASAADVARMRSKFKQLALLVQSEVG